METWKPKGSLPRSRRPHQSLWRWDCPLPVIQPQSLHETRDQASSDLRLRSLRMTQSGWRTSNSFSILSSSVMSGYCSWRWSRKVSTAARQRPSNLDAGRNSVVGKLLGNITTPPAPPRTPKHPRGAVRVASSKARKTVSFNVSSSSDKESGEYSVSSSDDEPAPDMSINASVASKATLWRLMAQLNYTCDPSSCRSTFVTTPARLSIGSQTPLLMDPLTFARLLPADTKIWIGRALSWPESPSGSSRFMTKLLYVSRWVTRFQLKLKKHF